MTPERKQQLIDYYQDMLDRSKSEQDTYYFGSMLEFIKNGIKPDFDTEGRQKKPKLKTSIAVLRNEVAEHTTQPARVYCGINGVTYKSINKAARALGTSYFLLTRQLNGHNENKFQVSIVE